MYHIWPFAYIGVAPLEKYQNFHRNLKRSITSAASTDGYTDMFNLDKATRADLDNFVNTSCPLGAHLMTTGWVTGDYLVNTWETYTGV